MTISEAINIFKKKHACLKQFKTNLNKCDCILCEDCSYFVLSELYKEAIETIIEYFEKGTEKTNGER